MLVIATMFIGIMVILQSVMNEEIKNKNAVMIVTAKNVRDSLALYEANADYVIYPLLVNEQHVSILLEDYTSDINKVISKKIMEITRLKEREEKHKETVEENKFLDIDNFMQLTLLRDPIKTIRKTFQIGEDEPEAKTVKRQRE